MLNKNHLNPNNDFGNLMDQTLETFTKLLEEKKLSQFRVSKDLGYSPSYFYNWTKGRSFPTLMALCNIAEYLDVTLIELMGFKKDNISETEKEILRSYNSLNAKRQMDVVAMLVNLKKEQEKEDNEFRKKIETENNDNNKA